jgi:hypothetical protein
VELVLAGGLGPNQRGKIYGDNHYIDGCHCGQRDLDFMPGVAKIGHLFSSSGFA